MISSLLDLPVRAVNLALAPTRFALRTVARMLRDEEQEVPTQAPPPPSPPPAPPVREEAPRRPAAAKPSPKAARRAARHEPTRGQAAAIRERQREEEQRAGRAHTAGGGGSAGPGPEIEVAEPWPGYAQMSEDDVLDRLTGADDTVRAAVRLYESMHDNRRQVVLATE